jgi:mannose-6-phosphate isomerase-like protein (cupin superfamily)
MTVKGNNYCVEQIGLFENLLKREWRGLIGKHFVGKELGLTGCEVSINCLPAKKGMPFVHSHKKNEELYVVLRGKGIFHVDGIEFPIQEGSLIRVSPKGERAISAGDADMVYICIQSEVGSLSQATLEDGIRSSSKTSWM